MEDPEKILTPQPLSGESGKARLRELVSEASVSIVVYSGPDYVVETCNDKALEMWGKTKKEVLNKKLLDISPGHIRLKTILDTVFLKGETCMENEFPVRYMREGKLHDCFFNFIFRARYDNENKITGVMCFGIDVTDQVRARQKTEQSERELHQLFLDAPICIVLFEGKELIARVANKLALQMMGRTESEVLNRPIEEIFPDLAAHRIEIYREVFATGIPYVGKEIAVEFSRQGEIHKGYYDLNYTPWCDADGRVKGVMAVGTEVTEKVASRQKIEASEKRYADLIHGLPAAVYTCNISGHIGQYNDAAVKLWGQAPDPEKDLWGGDWKVYSTDERLLTFEECPTAILLKTGKSTSREIVIERVDGTRRHAILYPQPIYDYTGAISGAINTLIDITEQTLARKKVENITSELEIKVAERTAQLRSSLDILKHAEQSANMGNWQWNLTTNELIWSDNLYKLFGYAPNEIEPTFGNLLGLVHPEDKESVIQKNKLSLKSKKDGEDFFRIVTKQGNTKYIRGYSTRVRLADQEFIIGTSQDITESIKTSEKIKEKNAELENSQSFLQQLIDSSIEFISVIDHDLKYTMVNKKFEQEIGMSREELYGKHFFEITPGAKSTAEHKYILKALEGKTSYLHKRESAAKPDFIIDTYFIPLIIRGKIEGVIIMSRDVTEILKSEKLLAQKNAELENINKELESFNYIASHDLQEPLRKIQTFISILEKSDNDPKMLNDYYQRIRASSQRMSDLLKSVLNYSMLSHSDKMFQKTDLNQILEDVKTDYELVIAEKGATIESDHLPSIKAVPIQMHQLFANLISNALRFSAHNPTIRIKTDVIGGDKVLPGLSAKKKFIELRFIDNGIGFDPGYSKQIFKLFQRLHSKSEYNGTGIGLSIVSKIVENHNGFVRAESEKGKGATFIVSIPEEK